MNSIEHQQLLAFTGLAFSPIKAISQLHPAKLTSANAG